MKTTPIKYRQIYPVSDAMSTVDEIGHECLSAVPRSCLQPCEIPKYIGKCLMSTLVVNSHVMVCRWVIRAQGSQYCWNPDVCADRWNGFAWFLMTSNHTREWISNTEHDVKGVFDFFLKAFGAINVDPILNPLWHSWNHVYIWSCSSDAFMGDAPACQPLGPLSAAQICIACTCARANASGEAGQLMGRSLGQVTSAVNLLNLKSR